MTLIVSDKSHVGFLAKIGQKRFYQMKFMNKNVCYSYKHELLLKITIHRGMSKGKICFDDFRFA